MSRLNATLPLPGMTRIACFMVLIAACTGTTGPVLTELGPHERVWAGGYWQSSNTPLTGVFDAEATLPADPALITPTVNEKSSWFDVTPDASRMAFATTDVDSMARLYAANSDGSTSTTLLTTSASIGPVWISPDGAYIAFTSALPSGDSADLYVIEVAHPENGSIKVSAIPDLARLGVAGAVWSPSSRYLAFTGPMTDPNYFELDVVDLTGGIAAAHTTSLLSRAQIQTPAMVGVFDGVVAWPAFDGADRLWYGATTANSATPPTQLFAVDPGASTATQIALPARSDDTEASVEQLAISNDGTHIAFAVDAPVANEFGVYYADVVSPTTPALLPMGSFPGNSIASLAFSTDDTELAAAVTQTAEVSTDVAGPYVVNLASGTTKHLVAGFDGWFAPQWSATALWYISTYNSPSGQYQLFRLQPDEAMQIPEAALDLAPTDAVFSIEIR